jgi:hypothetical protein
LPIPIATDPDGVTVFLSREVWQNHILSYHPEMMAFKDLIPQAISNPAFREAEDAERHIIRCYADIPAARQPGKTPLRVRVVVKYVQPPERDEQRTGLVSSAYLVRWKGVR